MVWAPAEGFTSFHIPAPFGKNDRIVAVARGTVKSMAEAKKLHNTAMAKTISKARKLGMLSHEAYFRMAAPNSPEALEYFQVDVWMSGEGMGDYLWRRGFSGQLQSLLHRRSRRLGLGASQRRLGRVVMARIKSRQRNGRSFLLNANNYSAVREKNRLSQNSLVGSWIWLCA